MERPIYVIGHKNPDSDSICSAIAYASLKARHGENCIAARAGNVNPQTAYVLSRFGVEAPIYLADVRTRVRDVMTDDVFTVVEDATVGEVADLIESRRIQTIPVLGGDGSYAGTIRLLDLAKIYTAHIKPDTSCRIITSLKGLRQSVEGRLLVDVDDGTAFKGRFFVGAMAEGDFSSIIGAYDPRECVIIVGNRPRIQEVAVEMGVRCLVVTGDFNPSEQLLSLAREKGVGIVVSPHDTATTAWLVHMSVPAAAVARKGEREIGPDILLSEAKKRLMGSGVSSLSVVDETGRLAGVLGRTDLIKDKRAKVILVDHNEPTQAVDGLDEADLQEIVDHHRLGNLSTTQPIRFINEPVGSTCTLVTELYQRFGVEMDKTTASLLLSGILSDTVILKSPTATERDRVAINWLSGISGEDYQALGADIFNAGSDLFKKTPHEIVNNDFKAYEAGGLRFGVAQIEIVGTSVFEQLKEPLLDELKKCIEKGFGFAALLVTDIVKGDSVLLYAGDEGVVKKMGYPVIGPHLAELKGVLSRKKQLIPHLLESLK